MGIIEEIITPILKTHLGAYFEGLDNINISITSGEGEFTNLKLKTQALDELELPIAVQHGLLQRLHLKVPVFSLGSEPVVVTLQGLHVVAGPKHRENAKENEEKARLDRTKKRRLQLAELLGLDSPEEPETEAEKKKRLKKAEEESTSFVGKMKAKILANIQITVENIHIRYQDDLSNPASPFAFGITLDSLFAESADENWKRGWIKPTGTIFRKLAKLDNLCIYFDTISPTHPTLESLMLKFPNDQVMCKTLKELLHKKSDEKKPKHHYILSPLSAEVKLVMDIAENMAPYDHPKIYIVGEIPDIQLGLDQSQFFGILDLFQYFTLYVNSLNYLQYRPSELNDPVLKNPENSRKLAKLRWKYALTCVRYTVRDKANTWKYENIMQRKKERSLYMEIYRKKKQEEKVTKVEEEQLLLLEQTLTYDDIIVYRKLAYASIIHAKYNKRTKKSKGIETPPPKEKEKDKHPSSGSSESPKHKNSKEDDKEENAIARFFRNLGKSDEEKAKEKKAKEKAAAEAKAKSAEALPLISTATIRPHPHHHHTLSTSTAIIDPPPQHLHHNHSHSTQVPLIPQLSSSSTPSSSRPATPGTEGEKSGKKSSKEKDELTEEEDHKMKSLYEYIGFEKDSISKQKSDYPPEYVHTKMSFLVDRGNFSFLETDRSLPPVAKFKFNGVRTGVSMSGVSSLVVDGSVGDCDMFEYATLGGIDKPFPVVQRDEFGSWTVDAPVIAMNEILSFGIGIDAIAEGTMVPVDFSVKLMALPLLITISRPFIDRMLVFFDLYGRDAITEQLNELANQTMDKIKAKAEAQIKYALGARPTLLLNACVHAPRIQVPSDYQDPFSSMLLVDLGTITISSDTSNRLDSKYRLDMVKHMRQQPKAIHPAQASVVTVNEQSIDDTSFFYDKILLTLKGVMAGVVKQRKSGIPRRPPKSNSKEVLHLIPEITAIVELNVCNTPSPILSRAKFGTTITQLKLDVSEAALATLFEVIKSALTDTRPIDAKRELEIAEKNRMKRLLYGIGPADGEFSSTYTFVTGMENAARSKQRLADFWDQSQTIADTSESTISDSAITDSECESDMEFSESSAIINRLPSSSNLKESTEMLGKSTEKKKERIEVALFEANCKLDGISVSLHSPTKPVITLNLTNVSTIAKISDQSVSLQIELQSFEIIDHVSEKGPLGNISGTDGYQPAYLIRSLSPPKQALIHITYVQIDPRCARYQQMDHCVDVNMQGLEITFNRLTVATLITVSTKLATSLQTAIGLMVPVPAPEVIQDLIDTPKPLPSIIIRRPMLDGPPSDTEGSTDESASVDNDIDHSKVKHFEGPRHTKEIEIRQAMSRNGIVLARINLHLKQVIIQLNKEGANFFRFSLSNAKTTVGIYPDLTIKINGSLSSIQGSVKGNGQNKVWSLNNAKELLVTPIVQNKDVETHYSNLEELSLTPGSVDSLKITPIPSTITSTPTSPRTTITDSEDWYDIIYVEGDTFGTFSLEIYDPSMPGFEYDIKVSSNVGGLRVVVLYRVIDEIITYMTAFKSILGVIGYLQAATASDAPPPVTVLDIRVSSPIIYIPRSCSSPEYIAISLGTTSVSNKLVTIGGVVYDDMSVEVPGLRVVANVRNPHVDIQNKTKEELTSMLDSLMFERSFIENLPLKLTINRAIKGNDQHHLPDVDISSMIPAINIDISSADLGLMIGLLGGNLSEFVLRKDTMELGQVKELLEEIGLVQVIASFVDPMAVVKLLPSIPFVKVNVNILISRVTATLYRGAGKLIDGSDSSLLAARVCNLDLNVLVTSDDGKQVSLNVERIDIMDCRKQSSNMFKAILIPSNQFDVTHSNPPSLHSSTVTFQSTGSSLDLSSMSLDNSSSSLPPLSSRSGGIKTPPFFKLRYEDRPKECTEFVNVTLLNPRIYIVPDVISEIASIVLPLIGTLLSSLDTWHQRAQFGSEAEQQQVLGQALNNMLARQRDELNQLIIQHRNQITALRRSKYVTASDENSMIGQQERDRQALLATHIVQVKNLKSYGLVPKYINPNEMRVKLEIEGPEICILQESTTQTTSAFIFSLGNALVRLSILPDKISVKSNILEFGIFKGNIDSLDISSTKEQVLLLQPFDISGTIGVSLPTVQSPKTSLELILSIDQIQTIVSYRDVLLGVEVFKSFDPMIKKIMGVADDLMAEEKERNRKAAAAAKVMGVESEKDVVVSITVKRVLLSVLNDTNPLFVIPVVKVTLGDLITLVRTGSCLLVHLHVPVIYVDGFNNLLSSYEPITEPWALDTMIKEDNNHMDIKISSEDRPLNVNVTKSMFDAVLGLVNFSQEMVNILFPPDEKTLARKQSNSSTLSNLLKSNNQRQSQMIAGPSQPLQESSSSQSLAANTVTPRPAAHHEHRASTSLGTGFVSSMQEYASNLQKTSQTPPSASITPDLLSTQFTGATTGTNATTCIQGTERLFDPFMVRNDTSAIIRVWRSSEGNENGFDLMSGQQMSLKSRKSSKHAADAVFHVNVELYLGKTKVLIEHIPIEKVHSQVYSIGGDRKMKILSEVKLDQGTKILTLSTTSYIKNSTTWTIDVSIPPHIAASSSSSSINNSSSTASVSSSLPPLSSRLFSSLMNNYPPSPTPENQLPPFFMSIPPGQSRSIPFEYLDYKEIHLRPQGAYNWYHWKDNKDKAMMSCGSTTESGQVNRNWSCCLTYTMRNLEGGYDYCLNLSPQLMFENLLAKQIYIKSESLPIRRNFASAFIPQFLNPSQANPPQNSTNPTENNAPIQQEVNLDVNVGDVVSVYEAQAAQSVVDQKYVVLLPEYLWSSAFSLSDCYARIQEGKSMDLPVSIMHTSDRLLTLYYSVYCPSPGCIKVSFYSKYWIINQTGLILSYKTPEKNQAILEDARTMSLIGNPANWYTDNWRAQQAAQRTYYSNNEISIQVKGKDKSQNSSWSELISLEQKEDVSTSKIQDIYIADKELSRVYTFKMIVATAPGKHWRTKEVRICPAYILVNLTDVVLKYNQFESGLSSAYDLLPNQRVPFHWPTPKKPSKPLFTFTTLEIFNNQRHGKPSWSIPFKLSELNSFVVKLKGNENTVDQLIQVSILERKDIHYVVFRNASTDVLAFYQIDNRTPFELAVEQKEVSHSEEYIPRATQQAFYWQNPLDSSLRNITLRLVISKQPKIKTADGSYSLHFDKTVEDNSHLWKHPKASLNEGNTYDLSDSHQDRSNRPKMDISIWEAKIGGTKAKMRMRLIQQGYMKILRIDSLDDPKKIAKLMQSIAIPQVLSPSSTPGGGSSSRNSPALPPGTSNPSSNSSSPLLSPSSNTNDNSSTDLLDASSRSPSPKEMFEMPDPVLEVEIKLASVGISLVDNLRSKRPSELVYASLSKINSKINSTKGILKIDLNIQTLQVDNQMKLAPDPVMVATFRAESATNTQSNNHNSGTSHVDNTPFLIASAEIDASEKNLVYVRQIGLDLQKLDVAVDQQFILAVAGFGEALAKYILVQSGTEKSVLDGEKVFPDVADDDLVSPNFFIEALKIFPLQLILSLTKGKDLPSRVPQSPSAAENLLKKITDPILGFGSLDHTMIKLDPFELRKVHASVADFLGRFATHYRNEAFANISKVVFNYLNFIKGVFSTERAAKLPIRLPRHFPFDRLVTPFNQQMAYGQNLLSQHANGKFVEEIYLAHVWLGTVAKWSLLIFTHQSVVLLSSSGIVWRDNFEDYYNIQYQSKILHIMFKESGNNKTFVRNIADIEQDQGYQAIKLVKFKFGHSKSKIAVTPVTQVVPRAQRLDAL